MFEHLRPLERQARLGLARPSVARRLTHWLTAVRADSGGGVAIMVGLLMPVMVLGMGLGTETGYQYMTQRNLQYAADLSAHAGGVRLRAGDAKTAIDAAALLVATKAGFVASNGSFKLNTPPATGPNAGKARSVEVLLTKTQARFFSAIISQQPVVIRARAVANVVASPSSACVLALAPTVPRAISISGSTDVSLVGCDVASNSNASDAFWMANSSAKLEVGCVHSVGGAVASSNLRLLSCAKPNEYAPVVRDPYADVAEPSANIPCATDKNASVFQPTYAHPSGVLAMRFCGGLDVKSKVTFKPGLYIIDGGDFSLNGNDIVSSSEAGIAAAGTTFYLTGSATIKFTGGGSLDMQAPTSGPYAGILFFASRSQSGLSHEIRGNFGSTTQGALYAPTSAIIFSGNSTTTNGCTQVIGRTVEFTGSSTLRSSCTVANARPIETNVAVKIVE